MRAGLEPGEGQAGGADGWRVRELKALPELLLDELAALLNEVERSGQWPAALEQARGQIERLSMLQGESDQREEKWRGRLERLGRVWEHRTPVVV